VGELELGKDVFRESRVQALVSRLLSGDLRIIRPVFDLKCGLRYPGVEQIIGEHPPSDGGNFWRGYMRLES